MADWGRSFVTWYILLKDESNEEEEEEEEDMGYRVMIQQNEREKKQLGGWCLIWERALCPPKLLA